MFKKIDKITVLLVIFMLITIGLFRYLIEIDQHIQKHTTYQSSLTKLRLIDKTFDNFLAGQATFINYDTINKNVMIFEKNLDYLATPYKDISDPLEYKKMIEHIKMLYNIKLDSLEYFKSQNSQLLYSMHYLFGLNLSILNSESLDKNSIKIANEAFLYLTKFYINTNVDEKKILDNLKLLKSSLVNNYDVDLDMFIAHVEIDVKRILGFNEMRELQAKGDLDKALEKLQKFLDEIYSHHSLSEKIIVSIFFSSAIVILMLLIMMNRRSAMMKDELIGFKTAIENSYNSIVITDVDRNITYVNDVMLSETGYSRDELMGQNPRIFKSGNSDIKIYKEMSEALENGDKWEGEFLNKRKDGSLYYEKASIMPIFQAGKVVNYLSIKLNITDYIEAKNELEHMAYHDSLTSLPNRTNIENYLQKRLANVTRKHMKIALLFIDLDRFKNINDTLGHDIGDELLIEASKKLKHLLRESDILSRFGGDEFIVVVEDFNDEASIAHLCEKIIDSFQMPIQTKKHLLNITLSIGISIFPDDANTSTILFKYADIAMYQAKDEGKNTYKFYQKELSIAAHNRLDMEQALKIAMKDKEFYMVYQPQYLLDTQDIVGVEALVRWDSEKLGFIPPDKFIPVCEDVGFILELGLFIFKQSCIDFLELSKHCYSLKTVSINISAVQLYQDRFIIDIMKIAYDVGIKPESIILEITETHIMKNVNYTMGLLSDLKAKGFRISIDDFGTGHSSLSYLKLFPISELKIDKSFIDHVPYDKDDVSITKAIIALSKSMGYFNVAEGVECDEQEKFLQKNGCRLGQGYYFCKPKIKNDLINFLLTKNG